ncbi:MAG TPA: ABC transporter permease, partial [Acidobacteriaceae bacterium]
MHKLRLLVKKITSPAFSWLRASLRRAHLEAEMEAELAEHFEQLTADLERAGFSAREARRRARIALGSTVVHKDAMRTSLGLSLLDNTLADLRFAVRRLRRSVAFTVVATISLALAIGANTTIFSLAKQLLYERLAVAHAEELRLFAWTAHKGHNPIHHIWGDYSPYGDGQVTSSSFSYPAYEHLRAQDRDHRLLAQIFAFKETSMNATIEGAAEQVQVEMVSGDYYAALGVKPVLGRAIGDADDAKPGQGAVVLISYGLWERHFGRSPSALGKVIKVNDTPMTIIGMNPNGFTGAKSTQQSPDLFVPLSMQPVIMPHAGHASLLNDHDEFWVNVMGRVRPGVSEQTARTTLSGWLGAVVRATMPVKPTEWMPEIDLRDGSRGLFYQQRIFAKPMAVLLTMVGFVLLLACANIANLMLARGSQRQREMSVRLALGAGRGRIARQMLVESVLLSALGGVGGLALGYLGSTLVPKLTTNSWERVDFHVHFDWLVFAFTALITLTTGILFGLAPAFAAAYSKVSNGLKETSQSVTRRRKGWGGRMLVGFQIALSTLLVVGAGLFLRTLASLNAAPVGFDTDHLLIAEINPPQKLYPAGKDIELHKRLLQEIAAMPGVVGVSPSWITYIADDTNRTDFIVEGQTVDKNKDDGEDYNVVGEAFFSMMHVPILEGRAFGPQDTATSAKVAIINAALAKERFPGQNPIGRRFTNDGGNSDGHGVAKSKDWITIVGVARDMRYSNLRDEPPPQFFLPFAQQKDAGGMVTYLIKTRVDPQSLTPLLRRVVQQQDPDLPLIDVHTQEQQIAATTQQERIFVAMTSSFGMLALAIAAV